MKSTNKHATATVWIAIAFMCLMASFYASAAVQSVDASVDKNPVMLDESFTLSVTADGDVERDAFDASFLLNDFVVGQTSVSSQTRMVNFTTSRSTTWSVILFPREVGQFSIPSITIDGASSEPIALEVVPVSNVDGSETRDIFVTTELDNAEVYLHQQVKYTVKLYLARDIERGSLQAPELNGAEIQQIGKDAEYSEIINGKRYRIIERQFVLIPQQSGTFTINGPVFQGEVVANTRQSFGFFNQTQTVNRVGPSQSLTVFSVPDNIAGAFLPSEFVDLRDQWSTDLSEWRVGEPVTRTLSLTAVGLTESLLPEINDQYPPDIKTYPDQADTASVEQDQQLVSQRNESTALIPSRAGTFVLPEVNVEWFNIVTKQVEVATLPARSVTVLPAAESQTSTPSLTPQNQNDITPLQDNNALPPQLNSQQSRSLQVWEWRLNNGWMWSTFVFALLCFALVLRTPRRPITKSNIGSRLKSDIDDEHLWKALHKQLKTGNVDGITQSLLQWLNAINSRSDATLASAIKHCDDTRLNELVDNMMKSRYAKQTGPWDASELSKLLTVLRKQHRNGQSNTKPLSELYPQN